MKIENREVAGRHGPIPVRDYAPEGRQAAKPMLVWLHGGGFISGGLDQKESDSFARAIAETGRQVLAVDYHLVPRWPTLGKFRLTPSPNRYPVPVDDVVDVICDSATGADKGFVLGGASAGACLAVTATMRLRDQNRPLPKALVLAYGAFHANLPPIPAHIAARTSGLHKLTQFSPKIIHDMNLNYAGSEEALATPGPFPAGGDLTGLPTSLFLNSDRDTLRASGEAFAQELKAAGVSTTQEVVADTPHGFFNLPKRDGFAEGIRHVVEFLTQVDKDS
ncbi:MAG: alpha/beta hydrolase [Propionibacteriaceae bacterium]|nr:alpha/beta hydrolase [Propionibacteriaceae bacterium]